MDTNELRRHFRGVLIRPEDTEYDTARRVWNGDANRFPALIARCTGAADVLAALRFAREKDLLVAVRGGGHSVAGNSVCDDGIVIDLSPMKGAFVNPSDQVVRAQAGLLWGELDRETQLHGLAVPGGVVSHTGIAGLTLGGGIGWLSRKHGATIDNVRSIDLVTAAGELLTASDDQNPELFWGLRGGSGNFGIATSFEYQAHPVGPTVLGGSVFFNLADGQQVLRRYRDWIADAPDELMTIVSIRLAPPMDYLPAEIHGRPVVYINACYVGDLEKGEQVLRPLRSFARPVADTLRPKPYVEHQQLVDPWGPHGWHYYWQSCELPPFTDEIIDVLVEFGFRSPSPKAKSNFYQLGGAMARVPDEATAFYSNRRPSYNASFSAVWTDDDPDPEPQRQWARDFREALSGFHMERTYVNFLSGDEPEPLAKAWGTDKYERLVRLKRQYDPDNVFRLNVNIKP
ncbi:FAD-binding oxidoreductase [Nonomuraea sp. NPDC050663]|uniref:FAD-binding oxidoreductase n=1 Tax=Nonomuraea sp. NPDC050663 TaxID=3364370 RepID=UPI0037AEBD97